MKATGNGLPEQCVANLLLTVRGEVPYERIKGLSAELIDRASSVITPSVNADITWLIKTYEPRVSLNEININAKEINQGDFVFDVKVTRKEEQSG